MNGPAMRAKTVGTPRSEESPVGPVPRAEKKRKSGVPTGNAGEYFVMGELLRRGFDAQLADRNTKGYDLLAGRPEDKQLEKIQIKTVRTQPWYVRQSSFVGELSDQITIYVLIGKTDGSSRVRYFIVRNRDVAGEISIPPAWKDNDSGFMSLNSLIPFEGRWEALSLSTVVDNSRLDPMAKTKLGLQSAARGKSAPA